MRILSLFSLATCAVGLASGLKKPIPAAFNKSPQANAVLKLRGGAGPLDPTTVAKTASVVLGVQGLFNILCTEAVIKAYGPGFAPSDENVIATKGIGFGQLSIFATAYQLLFAGKDLNTALACGMAVHVVSIASSVINRDSEKTGIKSGGQIVWLVLDSVIVYGLANNADWATTALKATAALAIVSCSVTALNPDQGLKLYGREEPVSLETGSILKTLGAWLVASSVLLGALACEVDTLTAIGYVWIVAALYGVTELFISKDLKKLNVDPTLAYIWTLFSLVVVGTLSIPAAAEVIADAV